MEFWVVTQLMGDSPPHTYSGPQVLLSSKVTLEVDPQKQGRNEALGSQYMGVEVNMGQAWKGYASLPIPQGVSTISLERDW